MKNLTPSFFKYIFVIGSSFSCLILLFFACGHPPTQKVKVFVNKPELPDAKFAQSVNIAIRFDSFGGTLAKHKLYLGENELVLPKGPLQVSTGYLATTEKNTGEFQFQYASVYQEVQIDKNTNTLEIHYPRFLPIQYRKFGLMFFEKDGSDLKPIAVKAVVIQDPIAGNLIQNPVNGNEFGFSTDNSGRVSVDLPVFDNQMKQIQLYAQKESEETGEIIWLPLETTHNGIEFYQITLDSPAKVTSLPQNSTYYFDKNKTVREIIEQGYSPRFQNLISSSDYTLSLENELKKNTEIDLLSPLVQLNKEIITDDIYNLSARKIMIRCKPHNGSLYLSCPRYTSKEKLISLLKLEENQKIDFIFVDQDQYSIFNDEKNTRDEPVEISVSL